jgi:phosphoglycolate phosphatase
MMLAVFDVDGTLVDSRASIAEAMAGAFTTLGLAPPDYDAVRAIVGMSLGPAIAALAPGADAGDLARLKQEYVAAFARRRAAGLRDPLYDGAEELLRELRGQGWLMAVATGKSRAGVTSIFDAHGLADLFDSIHCADDGPGKPDPYMLKCGMAAFGAAPARTIMIGDTSHDMSMARAAGVYAQGVDWGFHTEDEMIAGGAHHVSRSFGELSAALAAFRANARAAPAELG